MLLKSIKTAVSLNKITCGQMVNAQETIFSIKLHFEVGWVNFDFFWLTLKPLQLMRSKRIFGHRYLRWIACVKCVAGFLHFQLFSQISYDLVLFDDKHQGLVQFPDNQSSAVFQSFIFHGHYVFFIFILFSVMYLLLKISELPEFFTLKCSFDYSKTVHLSWQEV